MRLILDARRYLRKNLRDYYKRLGESDVNAITMASRNLAVAVHLSSAIWLSRLRAVSGYEMAVRVLSCSWFLILALVAALKVFVLAQAKSIPDFGLINWSTMLSSICLLLFYFTLSSLILHRPLPVSRTNGILPSLTAFVGTYLLWTIILFKSGAVSST